MILNSSCNSHIFIVIGVSTGTLIPKSQLYADVVRGFSGMCCLLALENEAWVKSGREPEVSWQTVLVSIPLIRKGTKWHQLYGSSMWIFSTQLQPSKMRELCALWLFDGWDLYELPQKPSGFFHSSTKTQSSAASSERCHNTSLPPRIWLLNVRERKWSGITPVRRDFPSDLLLSKECGWSKVLLLPQREFHKRTQKRIHI